jgi:hypothetical protein
MTQEKKMVMVEAAGCALSYKTKKPSADTEEVIRHVIKTISAKREMKIFGVAAASFVLKYLERNPRATEREVMQKFANETNSILMTIENQEELE